MTRHERIVGGLLGLLIGDATGVPYEFKRATELPPRAQIEMVPPPGFARTYSDLKPGTWSDDGAQALCLLASLLECDGFDAEDFGAKLVDWADNGYLAVDHNVFDIGITTHAAIRNLRRGAAAASAGPDDVRQNGNGALMRVLPLALWHRGSEADLVSLAHAQSRVTHGHLRSQVCCALYCLWAQSTLCGATESENAWREAVEKLRAIYVGDAAARDELETQIRPDEAPHGEGSGYVVDCLHSARLACAQNTFEDTIKTAIALGHDTDTTACVAGGIAGIKFGVNGIPQRWRDGLREIETVVPLLAQLLERE